jgi:hypothetical protein
MTARILGASLVAGAISALTGLGLESVAAQSLGELARRAEAQRKTLDARGAVYTNEDLQPVTRPAPSPAPQTAPTTSGPTATPPTQSGAAGASGDVANDGEGPGDSGNARDEAYWRQRMQTERAALSRAQAFAAALQSQINGLWAEFTACDAPPQCNQASESRQKAMAELERVQGEITTHTENIAKIQEEARRASVPAGWVR